jgi:hypothetical protein
VPRESGGPDSFVPGIPGAAARIRDPIRVLRVGDRVRFAEQVHTVVDLAGTSVRLLDELGAANKVLFTHLVSSD